MTLLSYILGPLAILLIVVGFVHAGPGCAAQIKQTVQLGAPDPTRNGPVGPASSASSSSPWATPGC